MNDYEILLALNGLEIARHAAVVRELEGAVGVKGALLDEVCGEIAYRRRMIQVLNARRRTFNTGAWLRNNRNQPCVRNPASRWAEHG